MKRMSVLVVAIMLMGILGYAFSAQAEPANQDLQRRIDQLEKELGELKLLLLEQQKTQQQEKARIQKIEQKVEQSEQGQKVEKVEKEAPRVLSQFQFKPYGYIKLDASYDDSRTNYGDFVIYIPNESAHKNDNEYNMTARQTRIGMDIIAPEYDGWTAKGRIEFDFYGDGSQRHENKAEPMLRHAFLDLTKGSFNLLAGQTSDLISPLCPNTLNYTVAWGAGNIGYRRPQLRLTYNQSLDDTTKLNMAVAAARSTGTVNEDLDLDLENDGEDAGWPTIQARLGLTTKLFTEKDSVFGISGHFGKEEIDWDLVASREDDQERVDSWSVNADIVMPLTSALVLSGEAFIGENLDDYFGGILQGVNVAKGDEIQTVGGWAQLSFQPRPQWSYNLGLGIDDPDNDDLNPGGRGRNDVYFANVLFNLIPPVTLGLEYSYWNTEYLDASNGTDNRLQGSVIYKW